MLGKPFAGWTNISLANKNIPGSYMSDIPLDFVEAINAVLETNATQVITIDAESKGEFIYVIGTFRSYIIEECDENGNAQIYVEEKNIEELANELANDILLYLEDWVKWNPEIDESEMTKEEYEIYKKEINNRKNIFNNYIKKYIKK